MTSKQWYRRVSCDLPDPQLATDIVGHAVYKVV